MIQWQAVTAICAVLTILGIIHSFVVLAMIRQEIRKLNGTYLRRDLATAEFRRINDHFDWLKRERAEQRVAEKLQPAGGQ